MYRGGYCHHLRREVLWPGTFVCLFVRSRRRSGCVIFRRINAVGALRFESSLTERAVCEQFVVININIIIFYVNSAHTHLQECIVERGRRTTFPWRGRVPINLLKSIKKTVQAVSSGYSLTGDLCATCIIVKNFIMHASNFILCLSVYNNLFVILYFA